MNSFSQAELVFWEHEEHKGVGKICGKTSGGWLVSLGRCLDNNYPFSCIELPESALEPIAQGAGKKKKHHVNIFSIVYLFYENRPGEHGRLIGTFHHPRLAIKYSEAEMKDELPGEWRRHHAMNDAWINKGEKINQGYYTIETSMIDRLYPWNISLEEDPN